MATATELAGEIAAAYAARRLMPALSARDPKFDLDAAYAVAEALLQRRRAAGHTPVGLKVGYANKAVWRALKLDTLVWAPLYDDTVSEAHGGRAALSMGAMIAPKIEPEIVLALARPVPPGLTDPAAVLAHVAWIALGFEIIDCPYPDWVFQPSDFVSASGLHAALIVGPPTQVTPEGIPDLVAALAAFTISLARNGAVVATGGGRNCLRSPALCVGELASALAARHAAEALTPGALISSGTLTDSQAIAAGEAWSAHVDGLAVADLTLHIET